MTNNSTSKNAKVKVTNLTKRFEMLETTGDKMKTLFGLSHDKGQEFWALRNVSFEVQNGETVGIIGLNGSGKSTISTLISGTMASTTGTIEVNGDVSIIALGTGLVPNLTGRENIHVIGLMMGMTNREISEKIQDIIDFSELGAFIDQPLKTYSSGMKAKLSFSIAAYQNPDILIIDEVLSVGDGTFGQKSANKMFEFREQGKTILLISHDMAAIEKWCDKVLWLHYGEVKGYGPTKEVLPQYISFVQWFIHLTPEEQDEYKHRVRNEQMTYSVATLKEELTEEYSSENSNYNSKKVEEQLNIVENNKLSVPTKIFLVFLAFICIVGAFYYTSSATSLRALADPVNFFRNNAFQTNTSFSEKINQEIISMKEKETSRAAQERNQKAEQNTTTESAPPASTELPKTSSISESDSKETSGTNESMQTYTIQAGDTISEIADTHRITIADIQSANPNTDLNLITPGQVINLPSTTTNEAQ